MIASEGATPGTATAGRALDLLLVTPAESQMGQLSPVVREHLAYLEEGIRLRLIALCAAAAEITPPGLPWLPHLGFAMPDLERHARALLAARRTDPRWAPTAAALDHESLKDGGLLRAVLGVFSAERELDRRLSERRRAVDGFVNELQT